LNSPPRADIAVMVDCRTMADFIAGKFGSVNGLSWS